MVLVMANATITVSVGESVVSEKVVGFTMTTVLVSPELTAISVVVYSELPVRVRVSVV